MKQDLLIATNGSPESLAAVEYGAWLADLLNKKVILLGIYENSQHESDIRAVLVKVKERLAGKNLILKEEIVKGDPVKIICKKAAAKDHLAVVGPLGRPKWLRWIRGGSFRYILKDIGAPMIYTRRSRTKLKKILVCMGGLGYASSVEHWALYLAQRSGADVTLLHVIEPIYYDYPTTHQIRAFGDEISKSGTPQGRNLQLALKQAQEVGVSCALKIRHGEIIHEIKAEIQEKNYDLVVMGSPESSKSLRHLFLKNITSEIAENVPLPLLIARLGQEPNMK